MRVLCSSRKPMRKTPVSGFPRALLSLSHARKRRALASRLGKSFIPRVAAHAQTKCQSNSTSGRGQSVVPNDAPRDFGPEVAFGAKFQIPVARQGGREMSAPRPYVTEPFRPLSSISNW